MVHKKRGSIGSNGHIRMLSTKWLIVVSSSSDTFYSTAPTRAIDPPVQFGTSQSPAVDSTIKPSQKTKRQWQSKRYIGCKSDDGERAPSIFFDPSHTERRKRPMTGVDTSLESDQHRGIPIEAMVAPLRPCVCGSITRIDNDHRSCEVYISGTSIEVSVQTPNEVALTQITPKLDKLRADQRSYLAYQKTSTELERVGLRRLVWAWEWKEACDRVKRKEADVEKKNRELTRVKEERKAREEEGKQAEKQKKEVEKKRDEELKKGGKFKKREQKVKELEKEVVKSKTQNEIKEGSIKDETTKLEALAQAAVDKEKAVEAKKVHLEECTISHATVSESFNAAQTKLNNANSLLQSLQTGLSVSNITNSGAGGGYFGQLSSAKQCLSQESAKEEQFRRKIAMKEKELKALEERWKGVENEMEDQKQRVERGEREIEELNHAIERSGWDDEKIRESDEKLREAKMAVTNLAERRDNLRQRLGALDFSYSPPSPDFNHSSVKGLVASLITLDEEHFDKSAALEIAGGRLYNVVVENEKVGKDLLKRGQLKKRVTIIPLDKINAFKASAAKLQAAHQLAGEKVNLALSLVGYEKDVSAAMSFVFGDTLIYADLATAQKVMFHPQIQIKLVTLQGDVYDPSGTLSVGAPPQSSGLLFRVKELKEAETEVANAKANLAKLERRMRKLRKGRSCGGQRNVKMEINDTIKMIKDLKESTAKSKEKQKEAKEEIAKLKVDMEDFKNNKDSKIAELKNKQSVGLKMHLKELQTAKLKLEGLERDVVDSRPRLDEAKASIQRIKEEIEQVTKDLKAVEAKHQKAEQKLQEERATLTCFNTEIDELEQVIKEKQQASSDAKLSVKKIDHKIQTLQKDCTTSVNAVATLGKAYEWIAEEKKKFGKAGGRFDFDNSNMGEIREKCKLLEEQQKGMKKSINQGVLSTLQTVKKCETELKKSLSIVLADKEKIVETIAELDRYKRDALIWVLASSRGCARSNGWIMFSASSISSIRRALAAMIVVLSGVVLMKKDIKARLGV
ncbi:hypothetical protein SISSUDRAFT_1038159 [Sistotremastrum suecicum HHB10207 ss-3]|uniref:SMC hinge domain-containing protein n=1 Tax=Sistotremastrum suecicum HHB10207 ss-3 TaxID=1314776 RepID=A0A165X5D1_9AGAM|nr:hypothetical protein SISSUDRAFT_1038159 [Sistotremastrum suecicum HHB10207 ss-3]